MYDSTGSSYDGSLAQAHGLEAQRDIDTGAAGAQSDVIPSVTNQQQSAEDISSVQWGSDSDTMLWIDRTSLDIAFDRSCFDSLDDQLLHHPVSSFADVCWADAVCHEPPPLPVVDVDLGDDCYPPSVPDSTGEAADTKMEASATSSSFLFAHDRFNLAFALDAPFADKLNTPDERVPQAHFYVKAKADPPQQAHPHFISLGAGTGVSDPSQAIGFFPTRPRRTTPRRSFFAPLAALAYFHRDARRPSRM